VVADLTSWKVCHHDKPSATKTFLTIVVPLAFVNNLFWQQIEECGII
jgi:hypothetical protein